MQAGIWAAVFLQCTEVNVVYATWLITSPDSIVGAIFIVTTLHLSSLLADSLIVAAATVFFIHCLQQKFGNNCQWTFLCAVDMKSLLTGDVIAASLSATFKLTVSLQLKNCTTWRSNSSMQLTWRACWLVMWLLQPQALPSKLVSLCVVAGQHSSYSYICCLRYVFAVMM